MTNMMNSGNRNETEMTTKTPKMIAKKNSFTTKDLVREERIKSNANGNENENNAHTPD